MATRRTSSSRSGGARSSRGTGSRRASTRASSSSNDQTGLFLGIGVVAVIAVIAVFVMGGGGSSGSTGGGSASGSNSSDSQDTTSRSSAPAGTTLPSASATSGKTPDRPAPPIPQSALDEAQSHYRASVELWNEGARARTAGESERYTDALKEAFDEMTASRDAIRDYTDWLDEADLEGWAIPAEYEGLRRRLGVWDRHYQKVKKLKTR